MDGDAPDFQVTQINDFTPVQDPEIARRVRGTFTVPCYLQPNCGPGGSFQLGADGLPSRNTGNDWTANFDCIIPRTAVDGIPTPARPAIYGHGLFGSASEVFNAVPSEVALAKRLLGELEVEVGELDERGDVARRRAGRRARRRGRAGGRGRARAGRRRRARAGAAALLAEQRIERLARGCRPRRPSSAWRR